MRFLSLAGAVLGLFLQGSQMHAQSGQGIDVAIEQQKRN
jgi:hypothetical protein